MVSTLGGEALDAFRVIIKVMAGDCRSAPRAEGATKR